jgi:VanZ family protein
MAGQWKTNLVFKLKAEGRSKPIHFETEGICKVGERTSLAIIFDGTRLLAYQEGKKIKERKTGPLTFSAWDKSYPLVIGSEANGKFPWEGRIYSIAIFDRALKEEEIKEFSQEPGIVRKVQNDNEGGRSVIQGPWEKPDESAGNMLWPTPHGGGLTRPLVGYDFVCSGGAIVKDSGKGIPADLVIPAHFTPYKRTVLQKPFTQWREFRPNIMDILLNVVGFIPLGFLFAGYLKHKGFRSIAVVLLAIATGFCISLLIEVLQAFLPSRSSDMMDLIANTFGTMIGCLVLIVYLTKPARVAEEF